MSQNDLERIYYQVRVANDQFATSKICANIFDNNQFGFRVYCSLEISCLKSYNVYHNDDLKITLKVMLDNRETCWLTMRKSALVGAGFGVYAEKAFKRNEFITVYMGKKIDHTYMYGELMGIPMENDFKGIHEEYWLGHRINHGSGKNVNARINANFTITAIRNINVGEEIFIDYNRDVYCSKCKKQKLFEDISRTSKEKLKCVNCDLMEESIKICPKCQGRLCLKCYDAVQINVV